MINRLFEQPTIEEIKNRKKMYEEAAFLGLDLMGFDKDNMSDMKRYDRRKAVVALCTK